MGRIQRLTKLILVSTKSSISSNVSARTNLRRRHSFGEDEIFECNLLLFAWFQYFVFLIKLNTICLTKPDNIAYLDETS
jgi:hypothetical protein